MGKILQDQTAKFRLPTFEHVQSLNFLKDKDSPLYRF